MRERLQVLIGNVALTDRDEVPMGDLDGIVRYMVTSAGVIQKSVGLPVWQTGVAMRVLSDDTESIRRILVLIPVLLPCGSAMLKLMSCLVALFNVPPDNDGVEVVITQLKDAIAALGRSLPGDSNTSHFLNAAVACGIPISWLTNDVFQFGYGSRQRLLAGSFTDATSRMGAALTRQKLMGADVLAQHGLPVPAHIAVTDARAAVNAAERIGYPVVVKPADLDGGVGVTTNIMSSAQLLEAVALALQHSPHLLVEKYVSGRDYRLVVLNGELIWAIERLPGGVTGDGAQNIAQLLEQRNAHPLCGDARHLPLKPLHLDAEAMSFLDLAGLDAESVPACGDFVRLRRVANIAAGGFPQPVFDQVHPDNRLLAERAGRAVGVDLAGVDLLIEDIARSWHETGAAICEVNAQPVLGYVTSSHVYTQILRTLVRGQGRIPIIVILGAGEVMAIPTALASHLAAAGLRIGIAGPRGVTINGNYISTAAGGAFSDARILIRDRQVDCAIVCLDDTSALDTGLPFDMFDVAILTDGNIAGPAVSAHDNRRALLRAIGPACMRKVLATPGVMRAPDEFRDVLRKDVPVEMVEGHLMPAHVLDMLQARQSAGCNR